MCVCVCVCVCMCVCVEVSGVTSGISGDGVDWRYGYGRLGNIASSESTAE